jgi:hypothetical protein
VLFNKLYDHLNQLYQQQIIHVGITIISAADNIISGVIRIIYFTSLENITVGIRII